MSRSIVVVMAAVMKDDPLPIGNEQGSRCRPRQPADHRNPSRELPGKLGTRRSRGGIERSGLAGSGTEPDDWHAEVRFGSGRPEAAEIEGDRQTPLAR